jgi:hypothetical protein
MARLTTTIILFLVSIYLPFWVFVVLALAALIYFKKYYEFIVLFFIFDLLFIGSSMIWGFQMISFVASIVVFGIIELSKRYINV